MDRRNPELAEKLVVFFVLVYRFFLDTSFILDLRPKHAGRDIFLYGIWGYLTENMLLIQREEKIDVKFIDNRDNFKHYEPDTDSRNPVGFAKHGWRLGQPIIEPAFQRSIGIFVQKVHDQLQEKPLDQRHSAVAMMEKGMEITSKIARDTVDYSFTISSSIANDMINDVSKGVKIGLSKAIKFLKHRKS